MIVLKFGGTTLGGRGGVKRCARIIARFSNKPIVVVASALAGVTDAILQAARDALTGLADISHLINLHRSVAEEVGCDWEEMEPIMARLHLLLRCVEIVGVLPAAVLDEMLSVGERLSVRLLAGALRREGVPAEPTDAPDIGFLTDDNHTAANPLPEATKNLRKNLHWNGTVRVVTGFLGRSESGRITTIGRNGSDLSASVIAAALSADELRIYTDTPGVLSADPKLVPKAVTIPQLSYEEAAELARFGATVLHPQTIIPLIPKGIPVRVVCPKQEENDKRNNGTLILPDAKETGVVVAAREGLALLLFHSHRLGEVVTDIPILFNALKRGGWDVVAVANSRSTIGFVLETQKPQKGTHFAVRNGLVFFSETKGTLSRIAKELSEEFSERGHIKVIRGVSLICVVGYGVSRHLSAIQSALEERTIPILFQALPGRDISIMFVVPQRKMREAVATIHTVLYG